MSFYILDSTAEYISGQESEPTPMFSMLDLYQELENLGEGLIEVIPASHTTGPISSDMHSVDSPYLILWIPAGEMVPTTKVSNLELQLAKELFHRGRAYIGVGKDSSFYFHHPPESRLLTFFGDLVLKRKAVKGQRTPLMVLGGVSCENIRDYLKIFGLEDTYINRGRVMDWIRTVTKGMEAEELQKTAKFNLGDFTDYRWDTTKRTKTSYVVFTHEKVGLIYGVSDLVRKVPGITRDQAKQVFEKFDLPVPSTVYHKIGKGTTKKQPKKTTKPKVESKPKQDLDHYIQKYNLHHRDDGYLNFESPTIGEMVAMNPEKLYEMLTMEGETISNKQANKVWQKCLGDD